MQGDFIVEKVKPDPLNLSVNTAVGSKYMDILNYRDN